MIRSAFRHAFVVAIAASCALGCTSKGPAPSPSAVAPVASPEEQRIARLEGLALADSRGSSALDQSILAQRGAARKNPKNPEPWLTLGRLWISKARATSDPGFYLNADACAEIVLALHEGDRRALDLRSIVLLSEHKFGEARDLSQRIVNESPTDPMAYGSLSDAHYELGDIEKAAQAAQKMVDIKPSLPSYSRVGYLAWIHGRTKESKAIARLALDAGKDGRDLEPLAWQLTETAMLFWHEGDYEGAEAGFDQALALFHDYPPALAGKGRAALARGDAKRAVTLLAAAQKASPRVETAWLLADARTAAGDEEEARRARAIVEKEGKQGDPRTLSLYWSTRNEHADEALRLAEEETKARPGIYSQDALAWAHYRKGNLAEASAAIALATKYGTKDARLLYHAGAIRMAQGGDKERAGRALVEQALALNPQFDATGAVEAKKLVGRTSAVATRKN